MASSLIENMDYYLNEEGLFVLTEKYLKERGYCCKNGCRHCPYGFRKMKDAYFNWSGGKDSSLALYKVLKERKFNLRYLLSTINAKFNRLFQHGVRTELMEEQARSIGIPLYKVMLPDVPTMDNYNEKMMEALLDLKSKGIEDTFFGDIFLEDLRRFREEKLAQVGVKAHFPLWKQSSEGLMKEFLDLEFKAVVVCIDNAKLDKSFAGRELDESFVSDLPPGVDVCGENGEYHSFVYDGPIFKKPVEIERGEMVFREYKKPVASTTDYDCAQEGEQNGFWYCDLIGK